MKKGRVKNKLNRKQKIIIGVTSVLVVTGAGFGYIKINEVNEYKRLEQSVSELYKIPGREKVFMNGKIVPVKSEKISVNPEQGELSQIKVADNAYVEKGAPLFTCKNSSQIKEIESLKEEIGAKNKERAKAEDEETKLMIDEEIKALNKQVNDLNKTAYSIVYAPFNGNVYLNRNIEDNSYVMVLETVDLYVQGQVNERDSYKINLDQGVEIKAMATGNSYAGKITEIVDRPYEGADLGQSYGSDAGMTKYEVSMSLDDQQGLKNGLNVQVVAFSTSTAIKLPNVSVVEEGGKYYVFKVKDRKAIKTEVKVIDKKSEYYLVENGLKENEAIVKDIFTKNINNGDAVYTHEDLSEMKKK